MVSLTSGVDQHLWWDIGNVEVVACLKRVLAVQGIHDFDVE